jgi:uncharacterized membrane-anchored protein YitT (DUF2179 family)
MSDGASATAPSPGRAGVGHSALEDVLALVTGALFVSFGVVLYREAGLLTGGTAGLAFLAHYLGGGPFGVWFLALNLPFFAFAARRRGREFALKTLAAIVLVSALSALHPALLHVRGVHPLYAAVMGGLVMGAGMLMLLRHRASLGGLNILALHAQDRWGLNAGRVQMAMDLAILASSWFVVGLHALLASAAGAVALNLVLALNHRPGRYVGF